MCNHRNKTSRRQLLLGAAALGALGLVGIKTSVARAGAATIELPKPGPYDSCTVCGMFPARYPDWVATIKYQDGHAHHFDGAKDFFKHLLDMKKYAKGYRHEQIVGMGVTGYYATEMIDAREAFYVTGSDVLSPMGHDLIPHPDDYDAKEFIKDHKGKHILTFDQVTLPILQGLDDGKFLK